ncbi:MAG: sugar phosphate isomerase/epimerase [Akkermansiaceae bacterium]|jgi:sugar phosphate isomerase/epimerase|nr:sugar phosphate isomerase/epimerase [Akkermansiaceae bacterium]MDP4647326.1 sugar phosphate isomerase/epimerase [Akkermansiaceae bacterium]MDP4720161.1 sugar phosphate isomerase/epimerase [Akkermansiaceae bacterium]MDP4779478.1 sugar phosphate isomerase/epimerase [Akkermansiaceae bacterium]MDP4847296.1 sugar phosphate isomerase/epimerase [Akkermansiaceae bacterium]
MKASFFKTLWGHEGSVPEAIWLAKEAGFEGLEAPAPMNDGARKDFFHDLKEGGVRWIAEVSTCTPEGIFVPLPGKSAREHLESLEAGVVRSLEGEPIFVNTMGGYDGWDFMEAMRFHEGVLYLEEKHGIPISVETHRGRYSHNPWLMREVLKELPGLKITCDFSHWCVVTERLVLDQERGILELAAEHAYHIQPRVGYSQGAQVPDPRAPEYEYALVSHEGWWDVVWDAMAARGFTEVTMTPEFGPDGYLQMAPYTQEPVADLGELNLWMAARLKERFERKYNC